MPVSVSLPALGESVTEGTVTRWLKAEGERVELDEPLLEVSTDKVDTEIPSPAAGVLASIEVAEDETVEVGAELAVIDDGSGAPAQEQAPAAEPAKPAEASPSTGTEAPAPAPTPEATAGSRSTEGTDVTLPALGESVTEGTVTRWLKEVGEEVAEDEPLLEVSTDKVDTEIPSPVAGVLLEITVAEDETAEVGAKLAVIGAPGAAPAAAPARPAAPAQEAPASQTPAAPAPQTPSAPAPQQQTAPAPDPVLSQPAPAAAPRSPALEVSPLRGRTVKLPRIRKAIADNMTKALHEQAQLSSFIEVDITKLMKLRAQAKDGFAAREGVKLSPMPFFVKAAVQALKAHPVINARLNYDEGTITYFDSENVAIAVDSEKGLMTPVIKGAGDLSIAGISKKTAELAGKVRTNKIAPDDLSGATFTISNTGSRGALFDTVIVPPNQVAILGIGVTVKRPVVINHPDLGESIAIRDMTYVTLSYDHRLVDGADAARYLTTVRQILEAGEFEVELGL
ncbi:2-oxoglutarate dehydrogenase E2 component [Streptomyces sp. 840.1]|uniref:2-oxo acid dehydrogenase subunit E2 n=1 Tax=Streptomyces sp. 840.1 TaxID=2485152 RepID=UPI000F4781E8|nr:2-oxo acid dehydrogenase subunit E2 [Streptomyces sp. 840.1]ROQ60140.1 2-oxoglutarate dehydrogenase E2 component [Streptomyces sp. 840.1]